MFPELILFASLSLNSFFALLTAFILLFLNFLNLLQLSGVFNILAFLWARLRFRIWVRTKLLNQGGSEGLTVIVLEGMYFSHKF